MSRLYKPRQSSSAICVLLLVAFSWIAGSGCKTASYAENGAGIGAFAGAVTGAALGDHKGNAPAGAVVGSAIGAVTGAALGGAMDAEAARSEAIIEQRMGRRLMNAVTVEDVVAMSQANLSDEIIRTHIKTKGLSRPMEVTDLIAMRESGVSDSVINFMQNASASPPARPAAYAAPRSAPPIIVEEHYYGPPVHYHRPRYPVYHPPRRRHRSGVSFSIHN